MRHRDTSRTQSLAVQSNQVRSYSATRLGSESESGNTTFKVHLTRPYSPAIGRVSAMYNGPHKRDISSASAGNRLMNLMPEGVRLMAGYEGSHSNTKGASISREQSGTFKDAVYDDRGFTENNRQILVDTSRN